MKSIFVLGSINYDFVMNCPRIPNEGETLIGESFFSAGGGKGANQALSSSLASSNTYLIGSIGNDIFGQKALDYLSNKGVITNYVEKIESVSTGSAVILVTKTNNRIVIDKGANACINKNNIDCALKNSKSGDYFITQFEINNDIISYGLFKAKSLGLITVVNPAPAKLLDKNDFKNIDYLIPNEDEYAFLTSYITKDEIIGLGIKLIVTIGEKGSIFYEKNKETLFPAIKVKAIDTTAAGDTFIGYFTSFLAKDYSISDSIKYATKASSITVTRNGAYSSIPSLDEVLTNIENK